jgi:predicted RNA binding protein YcfA (HicA-like mRNA interferase family)
MSPHLPHLTSREVVRLVEVEGFLFDHQKGSHAVYRHPDGRRVTIPMHASRTVGTGLLLQILRDADINPDGLRK